MRPLDASIVGQISVLNLPISINLREVERMVSIAEETLTNLSTESPHRSQPEMRELFQIVDMWNLALNTTGVLLAQQRYALSLIRAADDTGTPLVPGKELHSLARALSELSDEFKTEASLIGVEMDAALSRANIEI